MNTNSNTQWSMWWHAARPKTLPASIAPVVLGLSTAVAQGVTFHHTTAFNTLFCAILLQILANLANDYFDGVEGIDNHRKLGPKRLTQHGLVGRQLMKKVLLGLTALAFVAGIPLMLRGGSAIVLIGVVALISTYLYSTTAFSFSRHALGEVTAMLFFGPVAVWGTAFLQGGLERPWHIVLVGLVPGLMAAAIMGINNLRDLETDAKVGKITLAVIFGERNARLIPVMAIAMAYLFIIMFALAWSWFLLLGLLTVPLAYNLCFKLLIAPIDEQLNVALAMAGKLSMMTSLLLSLAFLLYVQHPGF